MTLNLIWIAIIMGIVEGITEFLPISSTGHLILLNQFLELPEDFEVMFDVVIQLGAILSVVVYFRKRLLPLRRDTDEAPWRHALDLWKRIAVGVIPALLIGAILGEFIETHLFNPHIVAGALVIGGIILVAIEHRKSPAVISDVADVTYGLALAIGFIQCLAMIPGTSRSAATIIGALLLGCSRVVAAEFSFFLAIPTMAAASGYQLLKTGIHISAQEWLVLMVGFITSFLVAWAVIAFLMSYIRRRDFRVFGHYRIALGSLVLLYFVLWSQ
jgi:undecaprenyl-diphosphatase